MLLSSIEFNNINYYSQLMSRDLYFEAQTNLMVVGSSVLWFGVPTEFYNSDSLSLLQNLT